MTDAVRILGIDPGSRLTGFGVVDCDGHQSVYVASGAVRSIDGEFPERLKDQGGGSFVCAPSPAGRACHQMRVSKARAEPLSRHLQKPELGDSGDVYLGLVAL